MRGTVSALLVGEPGDLDAPAVDALFDKSDGTAARVTIVAVASKTPLICNWAPVTGMVTMPQIKAEALARASEAGRLCAALLPRDVAVTHLATGCWADALRLVDEHNLLVLAGRPRGRRQRRWLASLAANPPRHSPTVNSREAAIPSL
jgi:hypothetical protein